MSGAESQLWSDLLDAVRPAHVSPHDAISLLSEGSDGGEFRRKIIEGVLYSRWFILTYHSALGGVVLVFTVWHWGDWAARRQRRRRRRGDGSQASSSSSSTIEGNTTPPLPGKDVDERTPLISDNHDAPSLTTLQSAVRKVRAIAMYQPPNLPIINKILPSNCTILLILLLLGLNLFYALHNLHWTTSDAFIIGDRMGLLFAANLPWLYVLAAKNQPIKLLTGYSYENLNILHRRLGEWMCLLAVFHGTAFMVVWWDLFRPVNVTLWTFLMVPTVYLGIGTFLCYELLYLTSLASFRQWWYEVFLGSHVLLQAGGLVFLWFHHQGGRVYAGVALGIFLVDRLIFRLALNSRTVRADLTAMEDGETVMVSADWPVVARWQSFLTSLFGGDVKYGWKPTEHVFLTVPALARKHIIQAHPFTIASAAPEGQEHAWFNLIIRAHDGFSRDLLRYAQGHLFAEVRLDGPYGSLHALEMLRSSDVALVVVGGSGIAVAYPLLWTLLHDNDTESTAPRRKLGLIWVVHEAAHIDWIGHERLGELRNEGLQLCIPAPTSKAGRPDVGVLTEDTVQVMAAGSDVRDPRVGVVVSGPVGMNRVVRNTCARLSWRGIDIETAVEKYGW